MKNVSYIIVVLLIYCIVGNIFSQKLTIPEEAIRIRVIANSNSEYDQAIKVKVKTLLQEDMYGLLTNVKDINAARQLIYNSIETEKNRINSLLMANNYDVPFNLNYGQNYFPEKNFNGVSYPEGNYESLVVTLGDGLGDNWWCVLFPPICLIEADEENLDGIEYRSYIKDLLDKYF